MKKLMLFVLIVIIAGALFVNNPNADEFGNYIISGDTQNSGNPFSAVAAEVISKQAKRNDCIFFSTYELGDAKYIGIMGTFFGKGDVQDFIDNAKNTAQSTYDELTNEKD